MCDSETSEGLCINSPGTVPFGTTECPGGEDYYCYTTKIEEQMQNSISEKRGKATQISVVLLFLLLLMLLLVLWPLLLLFLLLLLLLLLF